MALIVKNLRGDTALDELADFESRHVSLRESAARQATANKLVRS